MANPFLVLGSVAVGIITAGIGVLLIPGWIQQAQDGAASADLATIAEAQGVSQLRRNSYTSDLDELLHPADHRTFTLSDGPELKTLETNEDGTIWCAVVRSDSGQMFAQTSESSKQHPVNSVEAGTKACTPDTVAEPEGPVLAYTLQCNGDETVVLPMNNPQGKVEWGDGTEQDATGDVVSRDLKAGKIYTVKFVGSHDGFNSDLTGRDCFRSMDAWVEPEDSVDGSYAFAKMKNLTVVPDHAPAITAAFAMFMDADAFNQSLAGWDFSHATNLVYMFANARSFNQPVSSWDVSNVKDMSYMFFGAGAFNQDLDDWDVSSVQAMNAMFANASSFNGKLNGWGEKTAHVQNMSLMFDGAVSFNQPLDAWDTSGVTKMGTMFAGASAFNQPLDNWDTSHVTDMRSMFLGAASFNQPLDSWDTSHVAWMPNMFYSATSFSQDLSSWDVEKIIPSRHKNFAAGSALSADQLPDFS